MDSSAAAVTGFHHVAIRVCDLDRSIGFYTKVLGLRLARAWGEGDGRGALLDVGAGGYLELFAGGKADPKPEGKWYHVALRTGDSARLLARAREAGAPVTMELNDIVIPSTPPLPARIAFFNGPDGESIEVFQET